MVHFICSGDEDKQENVALESMYQVKQYFNWNSEENDTLVYNLESF